MKGVITQPEPHIVETNPDLVHGPNAETCELCKTEDSVFTGEEVQAALEVEEAERLAEISTLKSRLITARQFALEAENKFAEKNSELIAILDAARSRWETDNALVIAEYERTREYLEKTEKELRQAVIDWCRGHDTKKFDEHLSMRVAIKLEYDLDEATAWCRAEAPFALVADKKQFEKIAKDQPNTGALAFVAKTPAYTAVIASNLGSTNEGQVAE
jgi:hypothetical protein